MMRILFLIACLFPFHAQAWTFTPGLICRLAHTTPDAQIELTYDPSAPLYSVTVTREAVLPRVDVFSMQFIGPEGRIIATDRHSFGADGKSVTAEDTCFGNVLDGLQFNTRAEAILGDTVISFPLDGAAEPTALFRQCAQLPVA